MTAKRKTKPMTAEELELLLVSCRPGVNMWTLKACDLLDRFNNGKTNYPKHYEPIFKHDADRALALLGKIDRIIARNMRAKKGKQ